MVYHGYIMKVLACGCDNKLWLDLMQKLSIYQLQCDEHHSGQMDLLVYFIAQSIVKVDRGSWNFGNKFYQQGGSACFLASL